MNPQIRILTSLTDWGYFLQSDLAKENKKEVHNLLLLLNYFETKKITFPKFSHTIESERGPSQCFKYLNK